MTPSAEDLGCYILFDKSSQNANIRITKNGVKMIAKPIQTIIFATCVSITKE